MQTKKVKLKLKGDAAVFVDWANVYGWRKSLKGEVDAGKLYRYLSFYKEVGFKGFYYGKDKNVKSSKFLTEMRKLGFKVKTKDVKHIKVGEISGKLIWKRKCDFDIEICMDVYEKLEKGFESFVFFTGDGDFAPLYEYLIKKRKQVIVVYTKRHIGREIWEIKKGLFKIQINHLGNLIKKSSPAHRRGRD